MIRDEIINNSSSSSSNRKSMDLSMATCNAERAAMKTSEYRKVIKPLLERRRRARINNCLDELKALILETAQPENTDASKLEKADILELTVQHLKSLRHGGGSPTTTTMTSSSSPTPSPVVGDGPDKFRAGFAECAHEVSAFISALSGVETDVKTRLVTHLAHCVSRMPPMTVGRSSSSSIAATPASRMPIVPTPPPSPPHTRCGTPTTTTSMSTSTSSSDYTVLVSPISPPADNTDTYRSTPYQKWYDGTTHQYHPYRRYTPTAYDNCVYPTSETTTTTMVVGGGHRRSASRCSSVGTPTSSYSDQSGYYSDRADSPISPSSGRQTLQAAMDDKRPWRPW